MDDFIVELTIETYQWSSGTQTFHNGHQDRGGAGKSFEYVTSIFKKFYFSQRLEKKI